jgi:hypothetical protein
VGTYGNSLTLFLHTAHLLFDQLHDAVDDGVKDLFDIFIFHSMEAVFDSCPFIVRNTRNIHLVAFIAGGVSETHLDFFLPGPHHLTFAAGFHAVDGVVTKNAADVLLESVVEEDTTAEITGTADGLVEFEGAEIGNLVGYQVSGRSNMSTKSGTLRG